jgi:hypothetical protein
MTEPLSKLDRIEEALNENKIEPRGYVLCIDLRLTNKSENKTPYYIGVPMTKQRESCPFVFTLVRKQAMIFKDKNTIGKFISKFNQELKTTARNFWNGDIFIQDVDNQLLVLDKFNIDLI